MLMVQRLELADSLYCGVAVVPEEIEEVDLVDLDIHCASAMDCDLAVHNYNRLVAV